MKSVACIYWASTDMAFVHMLRASHEARECNFVFQRFSHHRDWFTSKRSLIKNAFHLFRQIYTALALQNRKTVIIFGTNICRIFFFLLFFKRNVAYIYNEMPSTKKQNKILFCIDKVIFRLASKVYLSSAMRSDYCKELFGLQASPGVLENIPLTTWVPLATVPDARRRSFIYAGTITLKRFSKDIVQSLIKTGISVDVFGACVGRQAPEFTDVIHQKGELSHTDILKKMEHYHYALLAYYRDEVNYELCAPIKIYEYIAAGCHVVSVYKNLGLRDLFSEYPALFSFLEDFDENKRRIVSCEFAVQREKFLSDALKTNRSFVDHVLT